MVRKNFVLILSVALCIGVLTNCNNKKKMPGTLLPVQSEIEGNFTKYYTLVDKEYEVSEVSNCFYVELERTDVRLPNFDKIGVGIELFDEEGKSIYLQKPKLESLNGFGGFSLSLLELDGGESGDLRILFEDWPESIYGAKTFKLTIQSNSDKKEQTVSPATKSDKAKNEWDKTLDEFEEYADTYVKLLKKANSGDMNALAEYAAMLEKAETLETQLNEAKGELTSAQVKRFNKIAQKMMNAATSM